jgi:hypothetical protein
MLQSCRQQLIEVSDRQKNQQGERMKTQQAVIFFFALIFPALSMSQECRKPRSPEISLEKFNALQKRVAYFAFLAEACGFENSLQRDFTGAIRRAFPSSPDRQREEIDKFRKRKQNFSDDAGALGIFKRCNFESGKTKGLISEVSEDISFFVESISSAEKKYSEEMDDWNECERERREAEEREAARQAEAARNNELIAQQQQYLQSEEYARKKSALDVNAHFRPSLSQEGTYVLTMSNASTRTADFQLKCFQTNGSSKMFRIAILPGQTQELGFLEGWPGNFVVGEYCLAYYNSEQIWKIEKR